MIIVTSAVVPAYTIKLDNFTKTQTFINEIWDCKAVNITIMDFWVVKSYVWRRKDSCMWNLRPSESGQ